MNRKENQSKSSTLEREALLLGVCWFESKERAENTPEGCFRVILFRCIFVSRANSLFNVLV